MNYLILKIMIIALFGIICNSVWADNHATDNGLERNIISDSPFEFKADSQASDLGKKVARNAANCLTGHIATITGSSERLSEYKTLIHKIVGDKEAEKLIYFTLSSIEKDIKKYPEYGSTKKDLGVYLIGMYCPIIDELIEDNLLERI